MKTILVGNQEKDNSIKDIIYDEEGEDIVKLNSFQQASYWIVCLLRQKIKEIYKDRYSFGSEDEDIEKFCEAFEEFTDICWRDLYFDVTNELEKEFNKLPKGNICVEIDTAIGGHDILNRILSDVMCCHVPDIRLSPNNQKESILRIYKTASTTIYKSVNHEESISAERSSRYNYILTGNRVEKRFFDIVKLVLFRLISDGSCKYAANTVCDLFCEAYIDYYEIDFGTGEKNEEFAAKLRGEFYWIIVNIYCFYKNQFAAGVSLDRFITLNKLDDIDVDSDDDVVSFIVGQIKEKCSQKG